MNPMPINGKGAIASILLSAVFIFGCTSSREGNSSSRTQPVSTNTDPAKTTTPPAKPNADGTIPSGTGVEKEKPAPGKGNVQGKAFYNGQPAVGVEAKLCKTFNQYLGGCSGETYTAKTDGAGEYLIKNVPPGIYEGLTVKVFDTPYFVFTTSGLVQSAKYKIEEGQTFFAPDTHLFKNDLKLLNPKAGSKVGAGNIEVKWDPYPDAAYYKFSIYADNSTGAETQYDYINKRVDGQSYVLDKPLSPGTYTCKVVAYNGNDTKLSESPDDVNFAVTGAAAK
jgi:hypothetical protein